MKTLELNQMQNVEAGQCEGQAAALTLALNSAAWAVLVAGPIGIAFAAAAVGLATYNLSQCMGQ